jgi:hypothetical protein
MASSAMLDAFTGSNGASPASLNATDLHSLVAIGGLPFSRTLCECMYYAIPIILVNFTCHWWPRLRISQHLRSTWTTVYHSLRTTMSIALAFVLECVIFNFLGFSLTAIFTCILLCWLLVSCGPTGGRGNLAEQGRPGDSSEDKTRPHKDFSAVQVINHFSGSPAEGVRDFTSGPVRRDSMARFAY